MSCEGVWSVEMKGLYGWERIGTAFLRNGEYLAASANHYSAGSYKQDGNNLKISTVVRQYGDARTVFGKKTGSKFQVTSKCKIKKNIITGTSKVKGIKNYNIQIRLTRLDKLE